MSATTERERLKKVYSSTAWSQRVDKMSDSQVIAIYRRLQAQGKI